MSVKLQKKPPAKSAAAELSVAAVQALGGGSCNAVTITALWLLSRRAEGRPDGLGAGVAVARHSAKKECAQDGP